jgi:hypothetical protein
VKLTIHLHLILTLKAGALFLPSTYASVTWCLVTEVIPVEYITVIQKNNLERDYILHDMYHITKDFAIHESWTNKIHDW